MDTERHFPPSDDRTEVSSDTNTRTAGQSKPSFCRKVGQFGRRGYSATACRISSDQTVVGSTPLRAYAKKHDFAFGIVLFHWHFTAIGGETELASIHIFRAVSLIRTFLPILT